MYQLPPLLYDYAALEPYIDARTMEIHYTKHHQTYIENLNNAFASYQHADHSLVHILQNLDEVPEHIRIAVRNNGGGHSNHSFFWTIMTPTGQKKPSGMLEKDIIKTFGSFRAFQTQFYEAAKSVFGSGWAWLCLQSDNTLIVTKTANQDSPYMYGLSPIIGLDVWEHAYYLKYQNKRVDYIDAWWHVVNWQQAEEYYQSFIVYRTGNSGQTAFYL